VAEGIGQYFDENPADGRRVIEKSLTAAPGPGGSPQGPAIWSSARVPWKACRCRASWPTARSGTPPGASCTSSRATRRWLGQQGRVSAASRRSCRSAASCINVEKARLDKIVSSENIRPLVIALGAGIGDSLTWPRLRYQPRSSS